MSRAKLSVSSYSIVFQASYYLDIKSLVNLTSRAIATQVSGKSTEEIRETLYNVGTDIYSPNGGSFWLLPLSSRRSSTHLERLSSNATAFAKENNTEETAATAETHRYELCRFVPLPKPDVVLLTCGTVDNRSLDELLQFIEKGDKNPKSKSQMPQNNKQAAQQQMPLAQPPAANQKSQPIPGANAAPQSKPSNAHPPAVPTQALPNRADDSAEEALKRLEEADPDDVAFWIAQEDQELGSAAREALDREVELFRQRLEADVAPNVCFPAACPLRSQSDPGSSEISDKNSHPDESIRVHEKSQQFCRRLLGIAAA